jgi:Xaa-Pro aminopeptidase
VAQSAEGRMRELGAEPSFPAIVGSGPNGALPHSEPGPRVIADGELVVIDMGARVDGYCSDGTRTWATGEISNEAREVYELVRRSQELSLEAIRAGISGSEADRVSRDPIQDAGRGDEYGHGLGHGVGLEVHEAPRLGKTSEDVLSEGDVVTVEPGVYVPGAFGVRIEDLVMVEESGIRNLSSTSKAFRIVG